MYDQQTKTGAVSLRPLAERFCTELIRESGDQMQWSRALGVRRRRTS